MTVFTFIRSDHSDHWLKATNIALWSVDLLSEIMECSFSNILITFYTDFTTEKRSDVHDCCCNFEKFYKAFAHFHFLFFLYFLAGTSDVL